MDDIYWTTKEGNKILPSQMTDEHLINTIKLLRRRANKIADDNYDDETSVMDGFGDVIDNIDYCVATADEILTKSEIYKILILESHNRGISIDFETTCENCHNLITNLDEDSKYCNRCVDALFKQTVNKRISNLKRDCPQR